MVETQSIFPIVSELPEQHQPPVCHQRSYLINGEIKTWKGDVKSVQSPVYTSENGKLAPVNLGHFPLLDEAEAEKALAAAEQAYNKGQGEWATMKVKDRLSCMETFIEKMKVQREAVVRMLMWEIGKTESDSAKEFDRTVEYIQDTIDAVKDMNRKAAKLELEQGVYAQIRRGPIGVVFCMGPYNYPLNETFATLIPALIMGNSTILKPAKYGVLLLEPLLKAFKESFPAGVVNIIYGKGSLLGNYLLGTGRIHVLAFIGSTRVANVLKKQHPKPNRLRTVFGLEAKNPAIVMNDCDIDATAKECMLGALSYNGQRCTALKIIWVHEDIAAEFIQKLKQNIAASKVGMPWENPQITPLPEPDKPAYLQELVNDATSKGAELIIPHGKDDEASMVYPKLLVGVNSEMKVYHEEQFGPVVPIATFSSLQEPIDYLTNSPYGQQASLFSDNHETIANLIDPLVNQVCRLNINSQCQRGPDVYPFNGRKDSAEGTLSVSDALRQFSIRTLVAAKNTSTNKRIISSIYQERSSNFMSTDFIL
ncbi:MAG: NADP-dependent glyceraldehyde-3-phosphate dehydrogenase [Bacteroidetes bacterium]|nr:NADP-dependent glyceraldehyde-3-phosphate dehydrogenase [Bacteroidota bacterium]